MLFFRYANFGFNLEGKGREGMCSAVIVHFEMSCPCGLRCAYITAQGHTLHHIASYCIGGFLAFTFLLASMGYGLLAVMEGQTGLACSTWLFSFQPHLSVRTPSSSSLPRTLTASTPLAPHQETHNPVQCTNHGISKASSKRSSTMRSRSSSKTTSRSAASSRASTSTSTSSLTISR
jgi:hypothetical protein